MVEEVIKNAKLSSSGRKLFSSDQKVYIVNAWESSGLSAPEFCRKYGLITPTLYTWRKNSKRGAVMGIQNDGEIHSRTELNALKKENEQLKLALAEAELDKRILKKKIEWDELEERRLKSSQVSSN
jgi:transposase